MIVAYRLSRDKPSSAQGSVRNYYLDIDTAYEEEDKQFKYNRVIKCNAWYVISFLSKADEFNLIAYFGTRVMMKKYNQFIQRCGLYAISFSLKNYDFNCISWFGVQQIYIQCS